MLQRVLGYAAMGWKLHRKHGIRDGVCTCPAGAQCPSPGKHPLDNGWQERSTADPDTLRQWYGDGVPWNVAALCGSASGIVVIDFDGVEGVRLHDFLHQEHGWPATPRARTGGGGIHLFFALPKRIPQSRANFLGPRSELLSTGKSVTLPPSVHASGQTYRWEVPPDAVGLAKIPPWAWAIADRVQRERQQARAGRSILDETGPIGQGERNDTMFRVAAALRASGLDDDSLARRLDEINRARCQPPMTPRELQAIVKSAVRYPQGTPRAERDDNVVAMRGRGAPAQRRREGGDRGQPQAPRGPADLGPRGPGDDLDAGLDGWPCTHLGNAQRLHAAHGDDLLYAPPLRKWFEWDGKVWGSDETLRLDSRYVDVITAMQPWVTTAIDGDAIAAWTKWCRASQNKATKEGTFDYLRHMVPVNVADLDPDDWLLNTPSAVVDLREPAQAVDPDPVYRWGRPQPHDRALRMSRITGAAFDIGAYCQRWGDFLSTVTGSNEELRAYLQRVAGYLLTGDTSEHAMFLLYGRGRNGKGTFVNTLARVMGDYAVSADFDTFLDSGRIGGDTPRPDLVRLRGARMVYASEPRRGKPFDEALIKRMTGGDVITARQLHAEPIEFKPRFKLVLMMNDKPKIGGTDDGIWSRVNLVPFSVTIPKERQDPNLSRLLWEEERNGILRWALEGTRQYLKQGLAPPAIVRDATDRYRQESDQLGEWIDDCCKVYDDAVATKKDLYESWRNWCTERGHYVESQTSFTRKLGARGFNEGNRILGERSLRGLRLIRPEERHQAQ
jgi:putative DNA primase/helicase